jgi:hypothetical protein
MKGKQAQEQIAHTFTDTDALHSEEGLVVPILSALPESSNSSSISNLQRYQFAQRALRSTMSAFAS